LMGETADGMDNLIIEVSTSRALIRVPMVDEKEIAAAQKLAGLLYEQIPFSELPGVFAGMRMREEIERYGIAWREVFIRSGKPTGRYLLDCPVQS